MLLEAPKKPDVSLYTSRVKKLIATIQKQYKEVSSGIVLLFAGFERESELFSQESSFFYMTGIEEPGVVLLVDLKDKSTLYVPHCSVDRTQWMHMPIPLIQENAATIGVDTVALLGEACPGYTFHPFFKENEYKKLLVHIKQVIDTGGKIFAFNPENRHAYVEQRLILERIKNFIPGLESHVVDISPIIAAMRRTKDMHEIEQTYDAIGVTIMAHEAAAQAIKDGVTEREVQGALEYIFTASGGRHAFPSIVAGGKNATVLHYTANDSQIKNGDLVLVDIGAQMGHYCADISRTYPVSGRFSARQRELYNIVLETQDYIAEQACPGMWLFNSDNKAKSLHHLAEKFLKSKRLGKYFPHGIGHFLGLDVHDVGDRKRPLQEGDLFTIEPGVYIPKEGIGIRIEDNYWMVKDGVVCLSEDLPKTVDEIEQMMSQSSDDEDKIETKLGDDYTEH